MYYPKIYESFSNKFPEVFKNYQHCYIISNDYGFPKHDCLYLIDLEEDEIHENEEAAVLAGALAGEGIIWNNEPQEGKIKLLAERDGLFVVNTAALAAFNMVDEVMCATLHTHTQVKKGILMLLPALSARKRHVSPMDQDDRGITNSEIFRMKNKGRRV